MALEAFPSSGELPGGPQESLTALPHERLEAYARFNRFTWGIRPERGLNDAGELITVYWDATDSSESQVPSNERSLTVNAHVKLNLQAYVKRAAPDLALKSNHEPSFVVDGQEYLEAVVLSSTTTEGEPGFLVYDPQEWMAFILGVFDGQFDLPPDDQNS